ncbi:hypothetical protein L208DRAFT_1385239 [Tricholoma matsutake]|nr:hypothetical protein L208DRAFT_1385239 [Tricholoma matsutake 945]
MKREKKRKEKKRKLLTVVINGWIAPGDSTPRVFASSTRDPPCEQLLAAVVGARFKGDGE